MMTERKEQEARAPEGVVAATVRAAGVSRAAEAVVVAAAT